MNSLRSRQLLLNAANEFRREREVFSKREISKKINEIKYLSAQKRVPKLTLRKEIIHLENKLKGILELEKKLAHQKSKESKKITSLKRQVTTLKNKLHAAGDKDLSKKVEKLSHLMGDYLARCGTEEDVALSRKLLHELEAEIEKPGKKSKKTEVTERSKAPGTLRVKLSEEKEMEGVDPQFIIQKARNMQNRLNSLKHEIVIHKELESKDPEEIKKIENQVELIQQKLREFYAKHPELTEVDVLKPPKVQHKMMFEQGQEQNEEIESQLPLPPPPRIEE